MNVKHIFASLLALTLFSGIACTTKNKEAVLESKPVVTVNDLPNMPLMMADGSIAPAKSLRGSTILILFQPDCDHCQREAQQIKKHQDAFKNYEVYFVSTSTMQEMEVFAREYQLNDLPNFHFASTDLQSILNNFGSIDAPSVFIYNGAGKLVARFNGETDVNLILNSI